MLVGCGVCVPAAARAGRQRSSAEQRGSCWMGEYEGRGLTVQSRARDGGETHWVNFHVGGCCGSPSTMISDATGADAGWSPGIGYVAGAGQDTMGAPSKIEAGLSQDDRNWADGIWIDGLQASASDDVRSAKQRCSCSCESMAQRYEDDGGAVRRGGLAGLRIDKGRRECGLKGGLLFGDRVLVYRRGFGSAT